jgi:1-deoxy-D-xylulose-5-phosphate reductoisomerase
VGDRWPAGCRRLRYPEGLQELAAHPDADIVVVATVGEAGFRPTEAALRAGNMVALASKELLVMGGALFRELADAQGTAILPIDSEHSALWQCLAGEELATVRRLILTASGGPFRRTAAQEIRQATAEQALRHPNWTMGAKVTVDSASLVNKGLELIEAHWLFGLPYERLIVIIHPESIIHSMVEFHDGSLKAQLGTPDMRLPIQYALGHPERLDGSLADLDLGTLRALTFEPPDLERFPLLRTAMEAGAQGGTAPAALCGADEAAVELFLRGTLTFGQLTDAVQAAMGEFDPQPLASLEQALDAYRWGLTQVRRHASSLP